jgi:YHS domain-containing protein
MNRFASMMGVTGALTIVLALSTSSAAVADDAGPREIPAALAPFEYLIGRWNGHGVPKDSSSQKFRGWDEKHTWAWKFAKGKPVGLTLGIDGGKILAAGTLTYEPAQKVYRLDGIEPGPAGAHLVFEGTLDKTGKHLELDHTEADRGAGKSKGTMRLSVWPNANFIRYTMAHDLKEAGSNRFTHLYEIGLTKDGESLGGTGSAAERPKCIVTGGAATMTLSYQGRTFSICCSGCKDEFEENPEKYVKKASLMAASPSAKTDSKPAPSGVGRFEDAFAGDVVDSPKPARSASAGSSKSMTKGESAADSDSADSKKSTTKTSTTKDDNQSAVSKQASRAASLLKLGQNLERSGKTAAALGYYRRVVKEFEKTPAAKTAAERIKALDQP